MGRSTWLACCTTGDWDAVVMTHCTFARVPVSTETEARFVEAQAERFREAAEAATAWEPANSHWLFMLGLFAIGATLVAGIALRVMAVAGVVMMVMMWAAEWSRARHSSAGALTGSTSPFVDYRLIYAITMGHDRVHRWRRQALSRFGDRWANTDNVRNHHALR